MKINIDIIQQRLEKLGVNLQVHFKEIEKGSEILIIPTDIDLRNGFQILTSIGWRSVSSKIVFGSYALPLLHALKYASLEKKIVSEAFAKAAINQGYSLSFEINKTQVNVEKFYSDADEWNEINIEISSRPFDTTNELQVYDTIIFEEETILGVIISLLEIVNNQKKEGVESELEVLPEGARTLVAVNKYERNIKNRIACINYYGYQCQVCGFDFNKKYGAIGQDFVHVHHKVPISSIGENYLLNPITDLIPVCPNCHYMLHKRNPPLTITELKQIVQQSTSNNVG